MRHLVGDGCGDVLAILLARELRIDEEIALEVEDGPPVLHRTETAGAGGHHQIELGQGVGDAEIAVVIAQDGAGLAQGEGALGRLPAGNHHPDVDAVDLAADPLEVAEPEEHQIGRHLRRRLEHRALQAPGERLHLGGRGVGDRHLAGGRHHAQLERRLDRRIVPHRREPPGVGVLELGNQDPLGARRRDVVEVEQPGREAVDLAGVVDAQNVAAGGKLTAGIEGHRLAPGVDPGDRGRSIDPGPLDGQVQGVERHARHGPADLDIDRLRPREGQLLGVGGDVDAVADRLDVPRQAQGCACLVRGSLRGRGGGRRGLGRGLGAGGEPEGQAAEQGKDRTHGRG